MQAAVEAVPFYSQEKYQCGPSALAMVLSWSGQVVSPNRIAGQVFTPSLKGSLQPAMVAGARRNGRLAYAIGGKEALYREIAAGHPVIILQNLGLSWYPAWHYAVVIAYDAANGTVRLHSGKTADKLMTMRLFEKTWARSQAWGLLVLPPDRLPVTATESDFVQAAVGLEKTGQFDAALTAYRSALRKWPQNYVALMGVGNSLYGLRRLNAAAAAFKEAIDCHPSAADAFNNLAQVLFELEQPAAAVNAVNQAIALGGPHQEIYHQTLNMIQSQGETP